MKPQRKNFLFWSLLIIVNFSFRSSSVMTSEWQPDDFWFTKFRAGNLGSITGGSGTVQDFIVVGDDIYVGGQFRTIDGDTVNNIARWDGENWNPLGPGLNERVYDLEMIDGILYAGGQFTASGDDATTLNRIAKWDGETWSAVGDGFNQFVTSLAVDEEGNIYAAGFFNGNSSSLIEYPAIAKWNGSAWAPVGSGQTNNLIWDLQIDGDLIYAGGNFSSIAGVSADNIAVYNGTTWSEVGEGVNGLVYALALSEGNLYAGGNFTEASGIDAAHIASWDGTQWHALAEGAAFATVEGLGVGDDGSIYAHGGGDNNNRIGKWNGESWEDTGISISGNLNIMQASGDSLIVGGSFSGVNAPNNSENAGGIVVVEDDVAIALSESITQIVEVIAATPEGVFFAGGFNAVAGEAGFNSIARFKDGEFSKLDGGLTYFGNPGHVNAIATQGSNVYVAGSFQEAGGIYSSRVAHWDGENWRSMDQGIPNMAPHQSSHNIAGHALAVSGKDVYVGGYFFYVGADEAEANNIARWDGLGWSPLGGGTNGPVYAIAMRGNDVFVGGEFTEAGGVEAINVARWDGAQWHALGDGDEFNGTVNSIAVVQDYIYFGGEFSQPGDNIVMWDGDEYVELDGGTNAPVHSLSVVGHQLFAGGEFTTAGSVTVNGVAKWDSLDWRAIGSGVKHKFGEGTVKALASTDGAMYVGGNFHWAGEKANNYIAGFYIDSDNDGIPDHVDNCPTSANIDQEDADSDGTGSFCDCDDEDEAIKSKTWYADLDQDGLGDPLTVIVSCEDIGGYVTAAGDCDDHDATATQPPTWYLDVDGDTYGNEAADTITCVPPLGYVSNNLDCNDVNPQVNPNVLWYPDEDGDGFGRLSPSIKSCVQPEGHVLNYLDCNDGDSTLHPEAIWYVDEDGDGFGTMDELGETYVGCNPPVGYAPNNIDCSDTAAYIYPGAERQPNGFDNDCDGFVDMFDQTLTFGDIADVTMGDAPLIVELSSSAETAVPYLVSTSSHISISGDTITFLEPGTVTITAKSDSITGYRAADDVTQTFCIKPAKPVITLDTENATLVSSSAEGNVWMSEGGEIEGANDQTLDITASGSYEVLVDIEGCVSLVSEPFGFVITSTHEANTRLLKVYPNPSEDLLIVEVEGERSAYPTISIYGIKGELTTSEKLLYKDNLWKAEINIRDFVTGGYLFIVKGKGISISGKFQKLD